MVQTVARKPDYSDLDLDFIAHPTTKDVVRKTGEDAIKRSVRNLILTNHYERPFRSHLGSNVRKVLFDNINPMTATTLINFIKEVIINYEPRVSLTNVDVSVSIDNNGFDVIISYIILNRSQPVTIKLFLERIR
ncbi:hypothetical protein EB001_09090 [bacterium]|jgi:phage baseplate assembly protein W|nr:hypothetical protein [bacterium]